MGESGESLLLGKDEGEILLELGNVEVGGVDNFVTEKNLCSVQEERREMMGECWDGD